MSALPMEFSREQKEKRAGVPVFDVVIEVEGGRQPTWTVVTAVAKVVDELLANGSVAKPDRRTPLPPDAILQEVCLGQGEVSVSFGESWGDGREKDGLCDLPQDFVIC